MTPGAIRLAAEAAEQKSAEVTDWGARIAWVIGLAVFIRRDGAGVIPACHFLTAAANLRLVPSQRR